GPQNAEPLATSPAAAGGTPPAAAAPEPATPAAAAKPPTPASIPKPSALPKPSAVPTRPPGAPAPAPAVVAPAIDDSKEAAAAAAWGRVDPDGTVWVRESGGERSVGQYPDADTEEALAFYVRRFLDLHAQVALFETRL